LKLGTYLARDDKKLIVNDLRKRDGATGGDEMRTPLEHEADVPEDEKDEDGGCGGESGTTRPKEVGDAVKENAETKDEQSGERNEEAVAVRGDAGPVRIACNEEIKGKKSGEQWTADARLVAPKKKKADDGEEKNGRPSDQAVIRREEDGEKNWRTPEPIAEGDVAGFERVTVDDVARDENGQQTKEDDNGEKKMTDEKFRSARNGGSAGRSRVSKGGEVLGQGFHQQDSEDQGVGIVDVEH